ncbi:3929_t:CDS:2, partial [Racocetra persica]
PLADEEFEELCALFIFTININAESGIVLLPSHDGYWWNCTSDIAAAVNKRFSINLVDYSTPITPGFGEYFGGDSSLKRIRGTGFHVSSDVKNVTMTSSKAELNNAVNYTFSNKIFYCDTKEFTTTQCDSQFMGLSNQAGKQWCLYIKNPFNNSQKAYVLFSPDETSTNATNIDMSI